MLVIAGTLRIDPAQQGAAIAAALERMAATRREPGCLAYNMSADLQVKRYEIASLGPLRG